MKIRVNADIPVSDEIKPLRDEVYEVEKQIRMGNDGQKIYYVRMSDNLLVGITDAECHVVTRQPRKTGPSLKRRKMQQIAVQIPLEEVKN